MKITFIDHYDSFSFNVLEWLRLAAPDDVEIERVTCDDEIRLKKLKNSPNPLVISPGPGQPSDYPETFRLIESCIGKAPILGICLGHQMLIKLGGGVISRAKSPWHGVATDVRLTSDGWITENLPGTFKAICYNSLVGTLPGDNQEWNIAALNGDGEIMMICHKTYDAAGVQFHPESFGQDALIQIAVNFIRRCLTNRSSSN